MYGEAIIERLHRDCKLRDSDNPMRSVFINTVGAILDDLDLYGSLEAPYLQEATGVYLDLHGKDLGVKRKHLESDDDYRLRLVYESLGYLTVSYLRNVYDLPLYVFVGDFNVESNSLTSDNPYIDTDGFMSIGGEDIQRTLNNKFILDGGLVWIDDNGRIQCVIVDGVNVIRDYINVYQENYLGQYFKDNADVSSVYLVLPNANNCYHMFYGCTSLTSVDLSLPSATNCNYMFYGCTNLLDIILDLPSAIYCISLFNGCTGLTDISLILPNATNCNYMFEGCTNLLDIILDLPSAIYCGRMFKGCTGLTNVTLNVPNIMNYRDIFKDCSALETIDVTIPISEINSFKSYVLGLELENLTSFIINGEEVEL